LWFLGTFPSLFASIFELNTLKWINQVVEENGGRFCKDLENAKEIKYKI
jgi:hypothetical protein